jgi:hypothetical protein
VPYLLSNVLPFIFKNVIERTQVAITVSPEPLNPKLIIADLLPDPKAIGLSVSPALSFFVKSNT